MIPVFVFLLQAVSVRSLSVHLASSFEENSELQFRSEFADFVEKHGRHYKEGTQEYEDRFALFRDRAAAVADHNKKVDGSWQASVNKLTDWTSEELKQLTGWKGGKRATKISQLQEVATTHKRGHKKRLLREPPLPKEVDWTRLQAMKGSFDQGACGSCWAVSTANVLRAHAEIHTPGLTNRTFSPQELVSCVPNPRHCGGRGGCEGATAELALAYVMKYGLASEAETPYAEQDTYCSLAARQRMSLVQVADSRDDNGLPSDLELAMEGTSPVGVHVSRDDDMGRGFGMRAWERLPDNQALPFMKALALQGPVVASVAANNWYSYANGVFDNCDKDAVIDHAVALVGYGRDKATNMHYWIVQNSWGSSWGEGGFIRLRRHADAEEPCGVDNQPELGTGCDGGPSKVRVCGACGILYDGALPHFSKL